MSTKLVILGILMEGEKHPYEIQQFIKHREMERYIRFQKGSLYYAVNQLEKDGYIEIVDVVKESNRPDKTIYRITNSGRSEFQRLLTKQFSLVDNSNNPLYAALAFANHMDGKELIDTLKIRIRDTEALLEIIEFKYRKLDSKISRCGLHMLNGTIEHTKLEIKWLNEILKDAEEGTLMEYGSLRPY